MKLQVNNFALFGTMLINISPQMHGNPLVCPKAQKKKKKSFSIFQEQKEDDLFAVWETSVLIQPSLMSKEIFPWTSMGFPSA